MPRFHPPLMQRSYAYRCPLDGDLTVWTPVDGNPGSPYAFTPTGERRFFRVR